MKEHGLLLSAPMVRARAAGIKTQTRRAITMFNSVVEKFKGRTKKEVWDALDFSDVKFEADGSLLVAIKPVERQANVRVRVEPQVQVGHGIWWRETLLQCDDFVPAPVITYAATPGHKCTNLHADNNLDGWSIWPWKRDILPAIHMPRWASRFVDTVTSVRAERIKDISEQDAIAEGLSKISKDNGTTWKYGIPDKDGLPGNDDHGWSWKEWCVDPREAYRTLYAKINGQEAVERNELVWVYEWKNN